MCENTSKKSPSNEMIRACRSNNQENHQKKATSRKIKFPNIISFMKLTRLNVVFRIDYELHSQPFFTKDRHIKLRFRKHSGCNFIYDNQLFIIHTTLVINMKLVGLKFSADGITKQRLHFRNSPVFG